MDRERRPAEAVLFRGLVESAPDALVIVDREGRIQLVNSLTERLFGYRREELVGQPVEVLVPERLRSVHRGHRAGYFTNPCLRPMGARLDLVARRKDGSEFPADIGVSPLEAEEDMLVTAAIRDITERKQVQAALHARLRQQAAIARLGELALSGTDLATLFDEAVALLAHTLEVEYAKVLELLPDGSALRLVAGVGWKAGYVGSATVETETKSQAGYTLLVNDLVIVDDLRTETRFSGPPLLHDHHVISGVSVPIKGKDRPFGVLGAHSHRRRAFTAEDIHFHRAMANILAMAIEQRQLDAHLEATVEERTQGLRAANERLEEASRHKSAFLANMSHELRTPLNSVLGFSELLQTQTLGPLTEKQARFVDHIHTSGKHLLALVDDLLDVSKVEAGKLELRPESFALPEAIAAALRAIQPQADLKRLQLQLDVAEAPATLTADPVRFKQILYNLLSNAVKFTPEGGRIKVTATTVRSAECEVRSVEECTSDLGLRTSDHGDFVAIAVADTGIGIRPADFPKLFQPFTQLALTAAKHYQGTGLGLALTKRLVELHGGTIEAASAGEGRGSTFTVRFPVCPAASDAGRDG